MISTFQVGDTVRSDLDGLNYKIVQIGSRNDLEPLDGAVLVGNTIIVVNELGEKHALYEWEVELV